MLKEKKDLMFDEEKHLYSVKKIVLPSVSSIIEPLSKSLYENINEYKMAKARDKGHEVHFTIDLFIKTNYLEFDEQYKGYIDAFLKFLEDYKGRIKLIQSEYRTYHKLLKYGGTIDIVAELDGELIAIDTKTTAILNKLLTQLQLPAYKEAVNSWNIKGENISSCYTLQLKPDATYVFDKVEEHFDIFLKLYSIYNYISKYK